MYGSHTLLYPPKKNRFAPHPPMLWLKYTICKHIQNLRKFQQLWTMPIDGSANSLNILLPALTDGILDMVGTESILVLFFRR